MDLEEKSVGCNEFPDDIGRFDRDDCVDDEFVDWCTEHEGHLICLEARNIEKEVDFDREVTKTWAPEGFGRLKGDDEIREFSVGSAGHMGFSDDEIVGEMKNLVSSFDGEDMLEEAVEDMKMRR